MRLFEVAKKPMLLVPIGPSGSGKSTVLRTLQQHNPRLNVFSLDLLRHKLYDKDDYRKAWEMSTQDPEFRNKSNAEFRDLIAQKQDLYVDNTNLTPKSRRQWIDVARRNGYEIVAITFDVPLEDLIARQTTRTDKTVPEHAVRQQHSAMKGPQQGEFDKVISATEV